jgi:hypothetical protein
MRAPPFIMPLAASFDLSGAAFSFAPLMRCAGASVVRTYLSPVGRAQHHTDTTSSVLGASASLIGSEFSQSTWLRPFTLPHPDTLSPLPLRSVRRAHNIPDNIGEVRLEHQALLG